jgi:hypothetical protein
MNSGKISTILASKECTLLKPRNLYQSIFILIISIMLISCSSDNGDPTAAIEAYIQALSDRDTNRVSNLSCADWEQNALVEADSFTSVGSSVENLACSEEGKEGSDSIISCTGTLVLDYNGEAQKIDLSRRTYIARLEDGEWRMCGYR